MTGEPAAAASVPIPCVRVIEHAHRVSALDWSPDGTRLAVGTEQGLVAVASAEGRSIWRQEGREIGLVRHLRWSPPGDALAATVRSGSAVAVWAGDDGRARWRVTSAPGHHDLAWSPDGGRIAVTGGGGLLDAASGLALPWGLGPAWQAIAWSPVSSLLAFWSGGESTGVTVVDPGGTSSGAERRSLLGHARDVLSLSWSTDSTLLASASEDGSVRIWRIPDGACLATLRGHERWVRSVAWLPGDGVLASGSDDRTVRLWSQATGQEIARLTEHRASVRAVAFSPDGTRLASASAGKTVGMGGGSALAAQRPRRWAGDGLAGYARRQAATVGRRPARRGPDLWVPAVREHRGAESSNAGAVAICPDGRSAVVGGADGSLRKIDLRTGVEIWRNQQGPGGKILDVTLWRDGWLAISTSSDGTARAWRSRDGRPVARCETRRLMAESTFSPDGEQAASAVGSEISVWNPLDGRTRLSLSGHSGRVWTVDWHPGGPLLASGGHDGTVRVWRADEGREVARHELQRGTVWAVCWSPDGEMLASGSSTGEVVVWSLAERRRVSALRREVGGVPAVAWSPDGRWLASGGDDSTVRISDPMTGEEVHCFSFEENYAWRLSWAPSGSFLAASLSGDTVRIFDTRAIVHPRGLFARPTAPTPLTPDLEPLPGALAALARLGLATPLSLLRSLLGLLAGRAGDAGDEEPLAILARHPGVAQLAALRWPAAARPGLLALLLRHLPRDAPGESRQATLLDECRGQISAPPTEIRESEGAPPPGTSPTHVDDPQALGRQLGTWAPPPGTSPTELRDALAEALGGEPIAPQAPPLPLAALTQAADSLDERLFTLLELVGSEAVAADPGLPLRLLPQVSQLPALGAPQRRLLGLRLRLDQGGPSHGSGLGAERTGIDLRGDLRALLPSQLALPDAVLRARHLRGDLLYRARDGREPPRLKPTVLLLDVSPPTFGPVEAVTRLAAHAVASSLLEAGLPAVLITAGGEGSFHPLERREDLVEIWIRRSLEEAQEARALAAARAMAETLRDGALEPIVLVLSHAFFGAEAAHSPTSGLRGLFVSFPGRAARPTLAEACERWEVLGAGEIERLHHRLGELVG